VISPKLVEVGRHLNIELITNAELMELSGEPGRFTAKVHQEPRYIDISKCTSCGECAKVCPISVGDEYNQCLNERKAAFKRYAQAIPGAYAISKRGTAPCKATCPAHPSIQGFIALMNQGKFEEALKLFKDEHPFPGACGRVCHHPCEAECTRNDVDQPLSIRNLHRFLADRDMEGEMYIPECEPRREDDKVAVIGSGPAGITCAWQLARKGYAVTVFEKLPEPGGMMRVGIPEYRLPRDVLANEIKVVQDMGVEIKCGVEFGKDITLDGLKADGYKAVFLATGLHKGRKLGVPGEDLPGVLQGVDFLRDAALGKNPAIGEKVVVVGGGNVAVDVALTAKRLGAKDVKMVCLESREEMPAWDYEITEAEEQEVEIANCWGPREFIEKDGKVAGVSFKACTAVFDEQRRFNPRYDESTTTDMEADTVIVAIGQSADLSFADTQSVETTPRGGLAADPVTLQTPLDWVFAGGDVFYGPRSVVEAVESGKTAAESIHRFVTGADLAEGREKKWDFVKPDTEEEPKKPRVEPACLLPQDREGNFKEVTCAFSEEDALEEASRCLKCGICSECYQCVEACLAKAVIHDDQPKDLTLEVGSVVLCPGSEIYDPTPLENQYHYKSHPNVLTSLEFERYLSASGPTMGHLVRPSDEAEPKKVAWLQCVGSRDTNQCGNGYCSSVCCMYAIKDAMIAKEHAKGDLDCAIFNMDIRTFGKDYEKYLERARDKEGVRFVKARVHTIDPVPGDPNRLSLRYADEAGNIHVEEFDIVVLSVGLRIPESVGQLAHRLHVDMDQYRFAATDPFTPVSTSRPGVYACGVFAGPKDIPSSVTEASAAAAAAVSGLAEARGTLLKTVEFPAERDVTGEEPRIGVFLCKCGINIAGVVDMDALEEYTKKLPGVVYVGTNLFTCSQDTQDIMKEVIAEQKLNRVVVASCTPKTHEGIFMDTLESSGLNKYLFEMANIRNQDSWVHSKDPEQATEKAKDLVRMAVARAATLDPLHEKKIPVHHKALVIGGGVAGMTAALALADQGYPVALVEKEAALGGFANKLFHTIEGADIKKSVADLVEKVGAHENVEVITNGLITDFTGFMGNFVTRVLVGPEMVEKKIEHGVTVVATGASEYQPTEYLYGQDERVMTQTQLSDKLEEGYAKDLDRVVMIQCVGSRNEENKNCSRICCQAAVKNALHIKKDNPDAEVFVLYRDMRTYGLLEDYFTKARKAGVKFFRYDPEDPPRVESADSGVQVTFTDHVLGKKLQVDADCLALSAGMRPSDVGELATIMKLGTNEEGYFIEAHVKLRPVDMATEGIFVAGTAHGPKLLSETTAQALAAAARAATYLSKDQLTLSAVTAKVDQDRCASCLICVRSCPFGVPRINEDGVSEIDEALCHGCGVCASECPAKAITLSWYADNQIMSKVDALLEGVL